MDINIFKDMMKTDTDQFENYNDILNNESEIIDKRIIALANQYNLPIGYMDIIITIEELSELQKSLTKFLRGEKDPIPVLEELVDVKICLNYVRKLLNITPEDEEKATYIKLNRLNNRNNKNS